MNSFAEETSLWREFIPFEKILKPLLRPAFSLDFDPSFHFNYYISFIEHLVRKILPSNLLDCLQNYTETALIQPILQKFRMSLPYLFWSFSAEKSSCLYVSLLVSGHSNIGVGRYLTDAFSQWLIPGKRFSINAMQSLNFEFTAEQDHNYYFHQMMIPIDNEEESLVIRKNLPFLCEVISLTIRSVVHARKIMTIQSFSIQEKKEQIEKKIHSLTHLTSQNFTQSIFEHMHQLFIKLYAEEKVNQLKNTFDPLLKNDSKKIDQSLFLHIQNLVLLFPEKFLAQRDVSYISRLVTTKYLFRKALEKKQGVKVRLFKTHISTSFNKKPVLGILVGISILKSDKLCDERHIVNAIKNYLPQIVHIKDSLINDHSKGAHLIYLEIVKENEEVFSSEEVQKLRKHLGQELEEWMQNICLPTFMPRNEEEVMRNIVILAQQIKYVGDIPQLIISFSNQTSEHLSFTIILVRLLGKKEIPLSELLKESKFNCTDFENKTVGFVRRKYRKEANVFTLAVEKKCFLRKDFSINLFEARRAIHLELRRFFGEIRDYNGGILSRQHEVFQSLCKELSLRNPHWEFFLENFFYSLTPSVMQTLLPTFVLKQFFLLFLEAIQNNFKKNHVFFAEKVVSEYGLILAASAPDLKESLFSLINQKNLKSPNLASTFVEIKGIVYFGKLYAESIHK